MPEILENKYFVSSGCAYGNVEFAYGRLAGTDLLSEIAVMGGYVMTKRVGYAADRDLPVEIAYEKSDASLIAKRTYSHDALGRVSARTQTRGSAAARSDSFGYNARSELTSATLGSDAYAYAFDYIGNRSTATEKDASLSYVTNNLNQYTSRGEAAFLPLPENPSESDSEQSDRNVASPLTFSPTYDLDGNATLVQTSTGTWSISYNGENRPIRFENAATQTVVECAYDSQGRRFEKKVTVAGTVTLHERYIYDGYLQIAAFDVAEDSSPEGESTGGESAGSTLSSQLSLKRVIFWDPEEPTATRPLAINILGDNLYFPTVDLTKNVCELVDFYGDVAATYDYAPFGAVSAGTPSGSAAPANPFQWSSEVYDSELDLVYYNYRHYSPADGRFLSRDPIEEEGGANLYGFVNNLPIKLFDQQGMLISGAPSSNVLVNCSLPANVLGETSTDTDFGISIKMGDVYQPKDSIFKRNCHKVFTKGFPPVISIRISKSASSKDLDVIIKHEMVHFEKYRKNWILASNILNALEGEYCSCVVGESDFGNKKARAAIAYGMAAVAYYENLQMLENIYFDQAEYGLKNRDEDLLRDQNLYETQVANLKTLMEEKGRNYESL